MSNVGRVEAIFLKRMKGGPMDPRERVRAVAGRGLEGNANQGGKRQVTILSREVWEAATAAVSAALPPSARRANVVVSGIDLTGSRGEVVQIGAVRIRIHGETRPCEQMDEAAEGLRQQLATPWAGGAYGEVLNDAELAVGDSVVRGAEGC
ncbi:MAG: MOSC domain-containing protein [Acidobacteria bacterium]|nr:MOSC domain-containing protein [Acidobacteriota bacterium]